jgi:archaeal flagellar protein FlaI
MADQPKIKEDLVTKDLAVESSFKLHPRKITSLPDFDDHRKINVRYPLIAPYAYAHIYWDKKLNELIYYVEEPVLTDTEKELLSLVRLGLQEMINISFIKARTSEMLIKYLELNIQNILIEIGTKISKETYNHIMYYIYRDYVGMNEIEPMMNDHYIEDVECNGANFPLYIVHRKYRNIRSNVIFSHPEALANFVEKLAQKCGKYVSYASPLLDGALPDGSRVNATYTEDITTRGPTFTIRKFTTEPLTPLDLMRTKTADARVFAYLWIAIEQKFNIMIIGETASGKTTFLNALASFIPVEDRICSIEDTSEINLAHSNWLPAVTRLGFGMPNAFGQKYGEITLFDLLKESFRQNPDYVILGETRGKEASVLFQGMASGHPTLSTFHADSLNTLVKRLETPPISLSSSLVEALHIVCVCTHVKGTAKNVRKLRELEEVLEVKQGLGKADSHTAFQWNPLDDKFQFSLPSHILKKVSSNTGRPYDELVKELDLRAKFLMALYKKGMFNFKTFNKWVNEYYKNPDKVLRYFNIE